MKRILYIDPFSTYGHKNFNEIKIRNLACLEVELTCVFRDGYFEELHFEKKKTRLYKIPKKYYKGNRSSFFNRIEMIKILRHVKRELNFKDFDKIILAAYDNIALYFSFIREEIFLVNHNNLAGLDNKIKLFFFKQISKRNIHLVFEDYMREYLNSIGIAKVISVSHGLPNEFKAIGDLPPTSLTDLKIEQYSNLIFVPSSSSSDVFFIDKLINDSSFQNYLKENNILLVLRGDYEVTQNKNIQIINKYLSKIDYRYLLIKSSIIIIKYPASFKYRTSAVFLDCVANNKIVLISEIEAFKQLESKINYNPYFTTIDELIDKVKIHICGFPLKPYVKIQEFNVDLNFLINQ